MSILDFGGGGARTLGGYIQGVELFLSPKNTIEHLKLTVYKY